jgi:site-specific DNA recombinase
MRVALYCRVSTDEQKQGGTIESQIMELETFAQSRGYIVVQKYIDDGWSGALLSRPELDKLRDDAAKHLFGAVLINDVDRLGRDVANLAVVKRDLEAKGVEVIFKNLPNDRSPLANFMVNVLGSFAEFERAMIADRTRRGRRFKVQERRLIMGNLPPYGYRYLKKDRDRGIEGRYEVDLQEARVVKMMFSWVADDGLSGRAVLRRLQESGVPSRKGGHWAKSSVLRILTNETYAGVTYYNKHQSVDSPKPSPSRRRCKTGRRLRDRSEWIPIPLPKSLCLISRETFNRVQSQLRHNRAFSPRNAKYFYLVNRVRRLCANCGASFVGTPCHGKRFYRCSNRDTSRAESRVKCPARSISADKIEGAVWSAVATAVQNPDLIIEQAKSRWDRRIRERAGVEKELASLRRELASLEQEEERVLAAYRAGVTTLPQFEKEISRVNSHRTTLEKLIEKAENEAPTRPSESVAYGIKHWASMVRERLNSFTDAEKQRFLGYLLTELLITNDAVRIRGQIPASNIAAIPGHSVDDPATRKTQSARANADQNNAANCNFASTPIDAHGHNLAPEFALPRLPSTAGPKGGLGGDCGRNPTKRIDVATPPPDPLAHTSLSGSNDEAGYRFELVVVLAPRFTRGPARLLGTPSDDEQRLGDEPPQL